jgi:ADP-ribosyl-[dinitrogen reductase] hydrolase
MTKRDRARGVLLGLAAGDRNGGPIRMAVRLAESLAANQQVDFDDIVDQYLDWWRDGAFDTGTVAAKVLELMTAGVLNQDAVVQVDEALAGFTAGCNPMHRNSPLAMAFFLSDEQLVGVAKREALLTHQHPLAGDSAAAFVVLCRQLIRGQSWGKSLQKAAIGRSHPVNQALQILSSESIKRGGFSPDVLAAAVYFVNQAQCFKEALHRSIQFAGPANYCPVLVGVLGGVRWGASSIPAQELASCSLLPRIEQAADNLAADWL